MNNHKLCVKPTISKQQYYCQIKMNFSDGSEIIEMK